MSPSAIQLADIGFFACVAQSGSLSAAARELGISTAAVSKRLLLLEARLGVALLLRTTRRMRLTPEGERFVDKARRILGEVEDLNELMARDKGAAKGLLRINASPGFGRMHVAPVMARFSALHPEVDLQLELSPQPPPLSEDGYDIGVRVGEPPDARVHSRHLASNRRLLCASPQYIARHGSPRQPRELARHQCIVIRQGEEAYGLWRLSSGHGARQLAEAVKVGGRLATNDGETAVLWALEGLGILMRSEFDIQRYLASGRLVQVLPQYDTPGADIYAVYPQRHQASLRVQLFVEFLAAALKRQASPGAGAPGLTAG